MMVTDLNMRGMDGYALSRQARKLCPELRIILVTGEISPDISLLAARAGISRVIGKPCDARQLREIIAADKPESVNPNSGRHRELMLAAKLCSDRYTRDTAVTGQVRTKSQEVGIPDD
jgi:CheY-like chemotaxis protein